MDDPPNEVLAVVCLHHLVLQCVCQLTENDSIVQTIHQAVRREVHTHDLIQPKGQILLHGQQAGIMSKWEPLVELHGADETRTRVFESLATDTVHSQSCQRPRALSSVQTAAHFHFTLHDSARLFFLGQSFSLFSRAGATSL